MTTNRLCLIMLPVFICGCSALDNLDGLATLGQVSRESDEQHKLVKATNDHYDALIKVLEQGHLGEIKDARSFENAFGEPVVKKDLGPGGQRWIYRYAIYRNAKDEVDVDFDKSGNVVKWERVPCQKFY